MKRPRIIYTIAFAILLIIEILIALYVHDTFIRPYGGDILVTILLCCLWRIFFPKGIPALPIYVFLFAALVEMAQYFDLVTVLGFQDNAFLSTVIGTSFSFIDLICYAVGCMAFAAAEKTAKHILK